MNRTQYDKEAYAFATDPQHYADVFCAEYFHAAVGYRLRCWRDEFYLWENCHYFRVPDKEIETAVTRMIIDSNDGAQRCDQPTTRVTRSLVTSVILCIKGRIHLPHWTEPNSILSTDAGCNIEVDLLGFTNRIVDVAGEIRGVKIEPMKTSPRFFNLAYIPYHYDEDADCPRWLEFLDDVMDGDDERIRLLQQWSGYLLGKDLSQHKFMLLAGEGSNGKTTFTSAIESMLGEDNVSHVAISQFGDRFALASTIDKRLNSTSESTRRIDEFAETVLKSYTSGDRMTIDRKFREPMHVRPTAKVMISTNVLPEFSDRSSGLWRRMLFVPFEKSVAEDMQDRFLGDRLYGERAGIFNWARAGYLDLKAEGRFVVPKKCSEMIAGYRRQVNPARAFLTEHYTESLQGAGVACGEVYDAYRQWCEANGYRPVHSGNFGKEVKRAFKKSVRKYVRNARSRTWYYEGVVKIE